MLVLRVSIDRGAYARASQPLLLLRSVGDSRLRRIAPPGAAARAVATDAESHAVSQHWAVPILRRERQRQSPRGCDASLRGVRPRPADRDRNARIHVPPFLTRICGSLRYP